ncbi:MAG: FtsX-like permease family protein [candidate division WOR-3 bacterium]
MVFWIKLAFKNIFRSKQRTILTLIPVVFGVMLLITMFSLLDGLNRDSINNLINFETASLKLVSKNFSLSDKKMDINEIGFIVPEEIIGFLINSDMVESFTYEIVFIGNLSDGLNKLPVLIKGIDFNSYIKTYKTFDMSFSRIENFSAGSIVVGSDILKYFDVSTDSLLIIQSRTSGGTFDAFDTKLIGCVSTGNPNIDRTTVFVNIDQARNFLDVEKKVSNVSIKLKKNGSLYDFVKKFDRVLSKYPGLKLVTWEDFAFEIKAIDSAKKYSGGIVIFVILIIGGVGIANTILLSIYERFKEIGTMRAMGAPNHVILKMFVFEGALIGLIGSIVGMVLGGLISFYLYRVGLDFSSVIGDMDIGYPIKSIFRGSFNLISILQAGIFGTFIGVLASFYPARRAIRENIIRILK